MNIVYWTAFSKRKNSTLRPSASGTTISNVRLKDNTSIQTPVFELSTPNLFMNYIQWEGRYYFVNNITLRHNNIYEVECECDYLATYKSTIGNYTAFVERSASTYNNMIEDHYVSQKQNIKTRSTVQTDTSEFLSSSGMYLVRTKAAPGANNSTSGVNTYLVTKSEVRDLLEYSFDPSNFTDVLSDTVIKAVFDPLEYLISIKWVPIKSANATTYSGSNTTQAITLGWWTTDAMGYKVVTSGYGFGYEISRGTISSVDWKTLSPRFSQYQIWIPGVGLVDLDTRYIANPLYLNYFFDTITGNCSIFLRSGTSYNNATVIASYQGQMSADMQLSQSSIDMQSVTSDLVSAAASAAVGNIPTTVSSLFDVVTAITNPTTNTIGSQGTIAAICAYMDIYLFKVTQDYCDSITTEYGRPLYSNVQLSTLSGFIKCANASVPIASYGIDKDRVNNYLNSGFYYE